MNKLHRFSLLGLPKYKDVLQLQEVIVTKFLATKNDASIPKIPPNVITAQFKPTYTSGRRDAGKLSQSEIAHLTADTPNGKAVYYAALRGGQTTYHGPGQLTAYPIIDLKRHGLTARCYVNLLEEVMIKTCARYGLKAFRTKDTGVWVSPDRKVGAIGVHMRRHISSHGVALNITEEVQPWFDRIVACGLEDKQATSFEREGVKGVSVGQVAEVFAEELATSLKGVEGVDTPPASSIISMPDEFANLLPKMVIMTNEYIDDLAPNHHETLLAPVHKALKDIAWKQIETDGSRLPDSGIIVVQIAQTDWYSKMLASIRARFRRWTQSGP